MTIMYLIGLVATLAGTRTYDFVNLCVELFFNVLGIVNNGKWLSNPAKLFVVGFVRFWGVEGTQNLAKYNKWLRVFMVYYIYW